MTVDTEAVDQRIGPLRGRELLAIARSAVEEALGVDDGGRRPREQPAGWLSEPRATFVSLHRRGGELRGCIGSLEAHRPLATDVVRNARAAAFGDPRFRSVTRDELPELLFEVSLLGRLEPIAARDRASVLEALRPGVDGVLLISGSHRATFLPQVWGSMPDPEAFLSALERKAGLVAGEWPFGTRCWRYRVEEFAEEEPDRG